jgi:hypothetical protein
MHSSAGARAASLQGAGAGRGYDSSWGSDRQLVQSSPSSPSRPRSIAKVFIWSHASFDILAIVSLTGALARAAAAD